jgi:hypothetical protein
MKIEKYRIYKYSTYRANKQKYLFLSKWKIINYQLSLCDYGYYIIIFFLGKMYAVFIVCKANGYKFLFYKLIANGYATYFLAP